MPENLYAQILDKVSYFVDQLLSYLKMVEAAISLRIMGPICTWD